MSKLSAANHRAVTGQAPNEDPFDVDAASARNFTANWPTTYAGVALPVDPGHGGASSPEAMAKGGKAAGGSSSGGGTGSTTTVSNITATVTTLWSTLTPPQGDTTSPTDTFFSQEWQLAGTSANINIMKAWQNYTGTGIKVGVVDNGVDYNHPDLNPHYLFNLDYDAVTKGSDAYGSDTEAHGTTVAGVIGAARDGSGIVGVAYNAGIAGIHISYSTSGPSDLADALGHLAMNGMDVGNASWGYGMPYLDNFFSSDFASSKTAIQNDVANGRGGLGVNIVFAAGNGRISGDNVNYHNYQNDPYVITVAGVDTTGHIASFSTPGAALLVSAPGGAYTDDRLGSAGYSSDDYVLKFGTSYAAPVVSGVIALMLQANPMLGYRDVQEILAYSSSNSDPLSAGWQTNGAHDWNGGGLHFSHDYGFGLVDATAAVRLAESWQKQSTFADMSTEGVSLSDHLKIPDGSGSLQSTITLGTSLHLDKVVVDLDITHFNVHDLTITLTSPFGTTAVLASHPAMGTGKGIVFETSANNFWGEDAKGDWTLTVTDSVSGSAGTLNGWTLQALGDAPTTPTVYIYTDEFAGAAGANRAALHDLSGTAGINTAAVTTDSYLDLTPGAIDTIAGRTLQIGTDTMLKTAWAGDGNDTIIANNASDMIEGGRGDDLIVAGAGADKLYGGPGHDTFAFNALAPTVDIIGDFDVGSDVIDFRGLFTALGYIGADPVADGWLSLASDSHGGTNFVIDPHNGQSAQTIVDVISVATIALHVGTDYLTTSHV